MKISTAENADHIRSVLHPFVEQAVAGYTTRIHWQTWIEAITGIPPKTISKWSQIILSQGWFSDPVVVGALQDFCNATQETGRYDPFCAIANYVLQKARKNLPGVPQQFPISDVMFVRNDPTCIRPYEKHGSLGPRRKPHVLCIRDRISNNAKSGPIRSPRGIEWPSVLLSAEFRFEKTAKVHASLENAKTFRQLLKARQDEKDAEMDAATSQNIMAAQTSGDVQPSPVSPLPMPDFLSGRRGYHSSNTGKKRACDQGEADARAAKRPRKEASGGSLCSETDSYALEMLSCTNGTRAYDLSIVFRGDKITFWYHDASGLVKTAGSLSLISDFEEVAAALVALACCDPSGWGALPVFEPPETRPHPESFPPSELTGYTLDLRRPGITEKVKITLGAPIFCQYTLVGRRTFVYEATSSHDTLKNEDFIVKFSQQVKTRRSEQDFIKTAIAAGVRNLPNFFFADDIWSLSNGPRHIFHPDSQPYDDRSLRAIVCEKYVPLQTAFLGHPEHLPTMVTQMLQCLHDLRYKAKILHRDVSVNNIMCDPRGEQPRFILIDFDLAVDVGENGDPTGATSKHGTGTLPFMSHEIIRDMGRAHPKGVTHRLRHDFEALYWTSLWCTARIEHVEDESFRRRIEHQTLLWETGEMDLIASHKRDLLSDGVILEDFPMTPKFERHRGMFSRWRVVYSDALEAWTSHARLVSLGEARRPFDESVLDGIVSLPNIAKVLRLPGFCPVTRPGFFDLSCVSQ